ncbi:hypothetical protein [Gimesia sp.]|uniref:hypothetical protein n=1 Tax=Gimesia sp. TaxID=2024833 RepID=UPI003A94802D
MEIQINQNIWIFAFFSEKSDFFKAENQAGHERIGSFVRGVHLGEESGLRVEFGVPWIFFYVSRSDSYLLAALGPDVHPGLSIYCVGSLVVSAHGRFIFLPRKIRNDTKGEVVRQGRFRMGFVFLFEGNLREWRAGIKGDSE